jgi:hypothetical protein
MACICGLWGKNLFTHTQYCSILLGLQSVPE